MTTNSPESEETPEQLRAMADAAETALKGEKEAFDSLLLLPKLDALLGFLDDLQTRRVALEGAKDPGLSAIQRRIQYESNLERAIRIAWEWFGGFEEDRTREIVVLRQEADARDAANG